MFSDPALQGKWVTFFCSLVAKCHSPKALSNLLDRQEEIQVAVMLAVAKDELLQGFDKNKEFRDAMKDSSTQCFLCAKLCFATLSRGL